MNTLDWSLKETNRKLLMIIIAGNKTSVMLSHSRMKRSWVHTHSESGGERIFGDGLQHSQTMISHGCPLIVPKFFGCTHTSPTPKRTYMIWRVRKHLRLGIRYPYQSLTINLLLLLPAINFHLLWILIHLHHALNFGHWKKRWGKIMSLMRKQQISTHGMDIWFWWLNWKETLQGCARWYGSLGIMVLSGGTCMQMWAWMGCKGC